MLLLVKKTLLVMLLGIGALGCASPYYGRRYYDRGGYDYRPSSFNGYDRGGSVPYAPFPYGSYRGYYSGDGGRPHCRS